MARYRYFLCLFYCENVNVEFWNSAFFCVENKKHFWYGKNLSNKLNISYIMLTFIEKNSNL